jgi:branched-chain amino acid transport system ATP-binding protein
MSTGNGSADALLATEHVTKAFGGLVAVEDVSFYVKPRSIVSIIGPNGAGKTTFFNMLTGLYKPTLGRIVFGGTDVTGTRPDIITALGVARTFQNIRLFPGMTVLENLIIAQHNQLMHASGWSLLGLIGSPSYKQAEDAAVNVARYWLDRIELTHRADDAAGALPYGDQRRLEIARAMCTDPVLLCLDEPAAGLNPRESAMLNVLLRAIRDEHATSILLIEHDMSVVMEISDHVVVLEYGIRISDGTAESVRNDPKVIAAYLGVEDDEVAQVVAEVGL